MALLQANNASVEEQIAGLLHDVSHTAFSHIGDWVFGKESQDKDYTENVSKINIWAARKVPRLNVVNALILINMGAFTIVQPRGFGAAEIPIFESFSVYMHITELDDQLATEYDEVSERINKGWFIKVANY